MGEAKRRRDARFDAYAEGRPVPRPDCCPACGSKRIEIIPKGTDGTFDCDYGACRDCRAIWEAFPPMYVEDPVCADPCDNCAFRPGSPEQQDPEKWRALIDQLKPGDDGWFCGRFYCHKNVPIDQAQGPGNFLFPKKPLRSDDPVIGPAIEGTTIWDVSRMRTCSGYLRMVWALNAKREREAEKAGG